MLRFIIITKKLKNFVAFYLGVFFKKRNNTVFKLFKKIKKEHNLPESVQKFSLLKKLNSILTLSNKNILYYHLVFKKLGWVNSMSDNVSLKKISDLEKLPVLTKELLRENFDSLTSNKKSELEYFKNSSGGSTGKKAFFLQTDYTKITHTANFLYFLDSLGIKPWQKITLLVWGSNDDIGIPKIPNNLQRFFLMNDTVLLNSSCMTESEIDRVINILKVLKFDYIRGYAQGIETLANKIIDKNVNIKPQNAVISTASILTNEMKIKIEKAFKCNVYNFYGSREVGAISYSTSKNEMNILTQNNLVEIDKYGDSGSILVTTLNNFVMPLIRYNIGDKALIEEEFNYLKFKGLKGRKSENFLKNDGSIIDGTFLTTIFNEFDCIDQFQIIQKNYLWIHIKLVLNAQFTIDDENIINNKFKKMLGDECKCEFIILDKINPTPSGKFLYVISELFK